MRDIIVDVFNLQGPCPHVLKLALELLENDQIIAIIIMIVYIINITITIRNDNTSKIIVIL